MARRAVRTLQSELFRPSLPGAFPSTRYQGSKAKLVEALSAVWGESDFESCTDAFGGTASVAYRLKQEGKRVVYNDVLRFNYLIGKALIENSSVRLTEADVDWLLEAHSEVSYGRTVTDNFSGVFYTDEENEWVDRTIGNLLHLEDEYKQALGFFALAQACIVKRPFNLFHRRNLYLRVAEVKRSFGNKASWDRGFEVWFRQFVTEANAAVFDNGQANTATCSDSTRIEYATDLVYCDPPYLNEAGTGVDYLAFYHFLEGLANYGNWPDMIDRTSKHLRIKAPKSEWSDKRSISQAFARLFENIGRRRLLLSYRSDGIPSVDLLIDLLGRSGFRTRLVDLAQYQYVLSTNKAAREIVIVAEPL